MKTKKIFAVIAASAIALSTAACGTQAKETTAETTVLETIDEIVTTAADADTTDSELATLFNCGYTIGTITSYEGDTVVNLVSPDHTDFRQAACSLTEDQVNALFELDRTADDYNQQTFDMLSTFDDLTIAAATLPDASVYEAYVGKTVQDMIDAGYDYAGYTEEENGNLVIDFYYYPEDGDTCTLRVTPTAVPESSGTTSDEDSETSDEEVGTPIGAEAGSYDDESVTKLTIGSIVFWEFS